MKKIITFIMIFTLSMAMSLTAFAYDYNGFEFADVPEHVREYGQYYTIIKRSSSNLANMYVSDKPMLVDGKNLTIDSTAKVYGWYMSPSDNVWSYTPTSTQTGGSIGGTIMTTDTTSLIWASYDVKTTTGELFLQGDPNFQTPLSEIILEVVGEEMTITLPKMGQTMMIILFCGVGLMALLMALPLLKKVFSVFRA